MNNGKWAGATMAAPALLLPIGCGRFPVASQGAPVYGPAPIWEGRMADWTEERVELLRSLWSAGRTASEIAETLGDVSRNSVIGKAHRLGLNGRPSPIKKNRVIAHTTFMTLTERMCRWPFGDPKSSDFHFCGKSIEISATYCPEHRSKAFVASKPKPVSAAGK